MISNLVSKEPITPLFLTAPQDKRKPDRPMVQRPGILQVARAMGVHKLCTHREEVHGSKFDG